MLHIQNATFARKSCEILKNISLHISEGEILSILGRNGAGKTTLIKCIVGLLQWNKGESKLFDKPLKAYTHKHIWQLISYVPQAKAHIFDINVLDMVLLGLNPFVMTKPQAAHLELAKNTLESLSLTHLLDKTCFELSGGELQMVLFARALVKKPKILILDEPESNLDFANQKIILETLKKLSQQGCAIILNTHFPAHAAYLSHKALLLYKMSSSFTSHSNALFGNAQNILTQEHLSALYNVPVCMDSNAHKEYVLRI
ncbi:ABC transporter ATP-binding protein [Helicobacter sp. MIT 21-1697]|uniref:ABC transporter ATP-binding protein n=1 Tax=Helicobacter sp. MIT 21-1697 TaxID=2993733 RepID=UPI00224B6BF5|nr:ABC transporter ATP-binding protein [Helicobacter sp. MIT 21-1697]MCX2717905.1 ABC transporter ATP-binding protein [Helicobacter sp. MIT 21-1697]